MKIMFVGSEATPFCKTGGLADVLGSLPQALNKLGHEVSLVLPKHKVIKDKFSNSIEPLGQSSVRIHTKEEYVGFEMLVHEGIKVYLIDNEYYFGYRENLYGDFDDGERYGYFAQSVIKLITFLNKDFDILHLHDWQTGLIPYIKKTMNDPKLDAIKTVFTIHNIAYQGRFDKELFPYLNVPYSSEIEHDGVINFLKTAIVTSDYISTVSPTYAEEITYAYFGYGMESLLKDRTHVLKGILNGIDYNVFSPSKDVFIEKPFSLRNYIKGKTENTVALLKTFHLPEDTKVPIIGIVSRLTEQKGFNLLEEVIEDHLANKRFKLIVLGTGDYHIEQHFEYLKRKYPKQVGLYLGYNDTIARKIYAGSDFFLMPSRYEPCGLSQLISLSYGTLPIVRQTGGLKDSIIPYNKFTKEGTGFGFQNFDAGDLNHAITQALDAYKNKETLKRLRRSAMQEDFSWEESAKQYIELYQEVKGG